MAATKKEPARCASCGARIVWARDANGRAVPIERCPAGTGTVGIQLPLLPGGRAVVVTLHASTPSSYRRHIESCPNAAAWRSAWRGRSTPNRRN